MSGVVTVPTVDVLIAGGGPVGLTLAAHLRAQACSVLLVEPNREPVDVPRAMHLDRPAVEQLAALGVRWTHGVDLDRLDGVSFEAGGARFPIVVGDLCPNALLPHAFHQPSLERQLWAMVRRSGIDCRTGWSVCGLQARPGAAARPDRIAVRLAPSRTTSPDRRAELVEAALVVEARLVVGCDGAAGPVRTLAGIGVRPWAGPSWWHAEDHLLARRRTDRVVRHQLGATPCTVVPGCGRHLRVERYLGRTPIGTDGQAVQRTSPHDVPLPAAATVFASRCYRVTTHIARHPGRAFGDAAVVLAGDAAHTVAPFLGQGLGLGLRDAALLAELCGSLEPGGGCGRGPAGEPSPAALAARYAEARRADVRTTALCSLAAQQLVERSPSLSATERAGLVRVLRGVTGVRPSLVHRLALASRQR